MRPPGDRGGAAGDLHSACSADLGRLAAQPYRCPVTAPGFGRETEGSNSADPPREEIEAESFGPGEKWGIFVRLKITDTSEITAARVRL